MGKLIRETATAAGDEIQAAFGHDDLDRLGQLGKAADVVIDFSRPEALPEIAAYVRRTGTPLLSGTTGYSPRDLELLRSLGTAAPILWSANFSLGVAVLYRALQTVSGVLKPDFDIEITETHHNQKADAPSGTAKLLVEALDPQHALRPVYGREGNCGKRSRDEIGHARPAWRHRGRDPHGPLLRPRRGAGVHPPGRQPPESSSTARCTWPGCCRESPVGS
jgi:4-hydroxy-tetrahydrodipicolinate reductase